MTTGTTAAPYDIRRRPRLLRKGLKAAGTLAALAAAVLVARTVLIPWAYPLPGRPSLTGYWQGRIVYSPTDSRQVLLRIRYEENCSMACAMTGRAKVCGARRDTAGDLTGDVHTWSGRRFSVYPHLPPARGDIRIETMDGDWRGDEIRMRAKVEYYDAAGTWNSSQQPPAPKVFEMHRIDGGRFDAACAHG
ncbi:hypothetical protein ACIBCP_08665 [Streptomyces sp. NPDC051287]|uniref:hypothetical protein n=1 Tax=Streptomyces sp. NPDC051287 TaxID=3365648 RepID=UPI00379A98A2